MLDDYNRGSVRYLTLLRQAIEATSVPAIASLNGVTRGGWTRYAQMLADSGAAAIELDVYRVAADDEVSGRQVEVETLSLVERWRRVRRPVAVELSSTGRRWRASRPSWSMPAPPAWCCSTASTSPTSTS